MNELVCFIDAEFYIIDKTKQFRSKSGGEIIIGLYSLQAAQ